MTERADHKALMQVDKARERAGEKGCGKLLTPDGILIKCAKW